MPVDVKQAVASVQSEDLDSVHVATWLTPTPAGCSSTCDCEMPWSLKRTALHLICGRSAAGGSASGGAVAGDVTAARSMRMRTWSSVLGTRRAEAAACAAVLAVAGQPSRLHGTGSNGGGGTHV